jgi:thiol:disulfide interchange protein DsbD
MAAVGLMAAVPSPARAQQPKSKDTLAKLQPKEVKLTASVSPVTARPGDEVTYTVTAEVDSPWHIYAFGFNNAADGPRSTRFDFFEKGGLEVIGDEWVADPEPDSRPEPAFDNRVFSFHEEKVAWSIKLKVPADATNGAKTLQSQVNFQICTDQTCKPPSRVSAPPVTVTIEGGKEPQPEITATAPPAERPAPQPRLKDTLAKLQPKEVKLSASVSPATARPGDEVTYTVTAEVDSPWHIYAFSLTSTGDGPKPTRFDFFEKGGLEAIGEEWTADPQPQARPEPMFENRIFSFHEEKVDWSIKLRVPSDATNGEKTLQSQINFMICTDQTCKNASRVSLSPVTLKIEGGKEPSAVVVSVEAATPQPLPVSARPTARIGGGGGPRGERPAAPEPARPAVESPGVGGVAEEKINQGLGSFLLWSALGGLAALVMPCTWPMIPITVNFFVKQGQTRPGGTLGLAFTYSLAIIGIYTLVGVVFSAVFGATSLTGLANNVWVNLFVGILFLTFGLSLLGLFEFRLPSFLLNASAQGESRGGLIGIIFMALTLTVTSFTCTFPVVGALLVMSGRGSYFYPVIGLATFALVLAIPFFVLAAAPGMLSKLPRSGDWMNGVKVVGGLIEIGAAFKFLNTAEVSLWGSPEEAWIDSRVMLSVWVVLSAVCGLYLLGLFRTSHDHDTPQVGPIRMLSGVMFMTAALYLSPALFGFPPRGLVYERLVLGLLAGDSDSMDFERQIALRLQKLKLSGTAVAGAEEIGPRKATSTDPKQAVREERTFHGVTWGLSYEAALEQAKASNRPVLIDFTGVNCANCRLMEKRVLPMDPVVSQLEKFVTVQLYTDRVPISSIAPEEKEALAEVNRELEVDLTNQQVMPLYVILSPDGKLVAMEGGYIDPGPFAAFLEESHKKATAPAAEGATAAR